MNIQNSKSLVRHEIMNTLTIILYKLENDPLSREEQQSLKHIIRNLSNLICYEDLLAGEKTEPFPEETSLQESLDYIHFRIQSENRTGLLIDKPTSLTIKTDKQYFNECLYQIASLKKQKNFIQKISPNDSENCIIFTKNTAENLIPVQLELKSLLLKTKEDHSLFQIQIALKIAQSIGITLTEKEKIITISLPPEKITQ